MKFTYILSHGNKKVENKCDFQKVWNIYYKRHIYDNNTKTKQNLGD